MDKKLKESEEKIAQLEKNIEILKTRSEELENNWKRALADYRNMQKRVDEEKQEFINYATASLLRRLLSVLDNIQMLNKHINDVGLEMITKEFVQILAEEGLKEIDAENKKYDVDTMEAIELVPGEKDKVVEVTQKGYFLKDKLLRPARVKAGSGENAEKQS